MPEHNLLTGTSLHESKRTKEPVRTASTVSLTLATPGASMDSVTLSNGDRVLLKDQSSSAQNGIYIFNGAASALTRADDADSAVDFYTGFKVFVAEGTTNAGRTYTYTTAGTITLGVTSLAFANDQLTDSAASANTVKAGPTSGGAATPSYRALVSADVPVMVASGGSHASGAAPDPGSSAGTTRYLREDASWQIPPGSGGSSTGGTGGSIVPIQTQVSAGTSGTITFSNVPTGFRNLRLTIMGRTTTASASVRVNLQYNGDSTGGNYANIQLFGNGSTTGSGTASLGTGAYVGDVAGTTATANTPTVISSLIYEYRGTTFNKAVESYGGTAGGTNLAAISTATWVNTAAISSIAVILASGNWVTGSVLTLWGEADTAPVLLTSNSNMIQETILTAAQASISITSIPQGYRDLRITGVVRGDAAITAGQIKIQFNLDTGSNYSSQRFFADTTSTSASSTTASTSGDLNGFAGANALASSGSSFTTIIPEYTGTTFFKNWISHGMGTENGTTITGVQEDIYGGVWSSTSAITSITLTLSSGNFAAGSTIRVYGEPAAFAGTSVGTGTRLRLSGNQSITTATATAITWDAEDNDADNQHFTSAANLTGTVTKSASSATLSGSSTAFLTELSVGQVISVPGTAAEKRVVIAIASNTSLTVNSSFVNSASGQTATRVNSAVVFRQPGFYTLEANIYSAALASGAVTLAYYLNSLTTATSGTPIGQRDPVAVNASAGYDLVAVRQFNQWDFVEVVWTQNSGGSVNVTADERTHWSISARPTVLIAVPYIKVSDSKTQNTAGGTFTSGSFATRDLNTVDSDSGGLATLSSNQLILPPGTYRCSIVAPAYQVASHQLRLRNITGSSTLITGQTARSGVLDDVGYAMLVGKFTITATTTLEVQHQCQTTRNTDGYGVAANFASEVYTVAEFWKEG